MDVMTALTGHQSIKSYLPTPVEPEKIEKILEAGRLAPSACNNQCRKFIVVTDPDVKKQIHEKAGTQTMIVEAPVVLVLCATPDPDEPDLMPCGELKHPIDTALCGAYMMLEAYEQGLGTCWLGFFKQDAVKEVLQIPADVNVVTMIPVGYHDGTQARKPRKPLTEIVSYNCYE